METLVDLSRLQFAITAMYHFLFVPLTLGLTWILVIMESIYVLTNKEIYRDMTRFWGKLFGINFAIGVTTGITLEFQFGTNWAYYSHYVGDIFGVPLAIEGLMAFFLESTFIGLFFFSWDKVSKKKHLLITIAVAVGSNLSALWILVANGWMNMPLGAKFNPLTMRMELDSFFTILLNPYAQDKVLHTVFAGYVTASIFVLAISSYYLLKEWDLPFARRSFKIAASFGFLSTLVLMLMGDNSGLEIYKNQQSKLVAIEGIWNTEKAPVGWSLLAWPDKKTHKNLFDIQIPYVASILLTHTVTDNIQGANDIIKENKEKIIKGITANKLLTELRKNPNDQRLRSEFEKYEKFIGYGLLLKKYTNNIQLATPEMIDKAADDTIPNPLPLFYTFRFMVGLGCLFFLLFTFSVFYSFGTRHQYEHKKWLLKWALITLPLPWISSLCGWFVAEYGRQPWTIYEILPTHLSVSSLSVTSLIGSLAGFIVIYTILFIIELFLMIKYAKLGPSSLGLGKYRLEK